MPVAGGQAPSTSLGVAPAQRRDRHQKVYTLTIVEGLPWENCAFHTQGQRASGNFQRHTIRSYLPYTASGMLPNKTYLGEQAAR